MKLKNLLLVAAPVGCLATLSSCYQQDVNGLLIKIFNSYTETYQQSFWTKLENDPLTKRKVHNSTGVDVQCPTDAILMWAYGPGYQNWNHYLHDGKESEIEGSQTIVSGSCDLPSTADPYGRWQSTPYKFKLCDYKLLDQAFDWGSGSSTLGINVHAYHGFEPDESDMVKFINESGSYGPDFDITKLTKQQAIDAGFSPENLVGKDYIDLGFLATAMDVTSSMNWIETETHNNVIPFLEMDMDKNVKGAYVSYTNKKFYDGFYLSWPREYQLLCQRNLKISVTGARWCKSDTGKDLLWMNCTVKAA